MSNIRELLPWALVLLAGTAWADGIPEEAPPLPPVSAAPRSAPETLAPSEASCDDDTVVGQVVAVTGAVHAQSPGGEPHALACDDPVRACETLTTQGGGRVAVLVGDVYAQVGERSRLRVDSGDPSFFLFAGRARVVDTRPAGDAPAFRIATPQLAASAKGGDAEVFAEIVGTEAVSRVCSHGDGLTVAQGAHAVQAQNGSCVEVRGDSPRTFAAAAPTLGLEDLGECRFELAGLSDRFHPTDVAAPPGPEPPPLDPPDDVDRDPCDDPGSGCGGDTRAIFDDPDPGSGCGIPGAPCGGRD
jgi:hypothetical protein